MPERPEEKHSKEQPIIIKKVKKYKRHDAHGGAWKVAYADFVTAMMALFIV
ncbi:MAG TPA: flagellar motor protein MotB, partial [Bacteroidota bacterium]|nr:flagellar motor protein MotB [Bacteroidota bacterium]